MAEAPSLRRELRLGQWEIDLRNGELRRPEGPSIRLQEQPLQILQALLERPGEVVSREELRRRTWPADTYVDFDHGLYSAIKRLRDALGDTAENPTYIETLSRRGYRLIAPVSGSAPPASPEPETSASAGRSPEPGGRNLRWSFILGAVAALGIAALALFNVGGLPSRWFGGPTRPITSVAVLPLENLSGDADQQYFADGMTDELITDLAQFSNLRIISRTSAMHYKNAQKTLPQIARELNVDAVVEGTVARSGGHVRIRVQLIQAADDRHLWAEAYERELGDVLLLQREAAYDIARQIDINLNRSLQHSTQVRIMKPDAYESYLKGRYFWAQRTREGNQKALAYLQQASAADPGSALPYAAMADVFLDQAAIRIAAPQVIVPKARAAAAKALEMDPDLAEAHAAMAGILEIYDWDWPAAEREYQRAVELNPAYAAGHQAYAVFLAAMGRFDQSSSEAERALQLDPVSAFAYSTSCFIEFFARRYDRAIQQCRKTVELQPDFVTAHATLANLYVARGEYDRALDELEPWARKRDLRPEVVVAIRQAYTESGAHGFWDKHLDLNREGRLRQDKIGLASIYVGLGDKPKALEHLEKAWQAKDVWMEFLNVDPQWDILRSEPEFQDLLRRMKLTQ